MAGLRAVAQTAAIASGTSKKTVLQIVAASNHRVLVKELSIAFAGTSNTAAPVLVQVLIQSDAGTGGDALTCVKLDQDASETLQTTAQKDVDGGEPTGSSAVMTEHVHPQGGFVWQAPFGGELVINGGDRLGIAVTAAATVDLVARMVFEE